MIYKLMKSPFEIVILRLKELGAFQFLFPFILTAAIFYGLLRKSQIFGPPEKNVVVNGIVALVAAFMVWSFPILAGVSIEKELATFMFQSLVTFLVVLVGLMITAFFGPENLPRFFGEKIGGKLAIVIGLAIIFAFFGIFFASGLSKILFPTGLPEIPPDLLTGIFFIVLLVGSIAIIAWPRKG